MDARVPVVMDSPNVLPRARTEAMAMPTPMSAVSSGSPAAAIEPKVISRTTAATATPMPSATPPAAGWVARAVPPTSTVRPLSLASSTARSSVCRVASVRSAAFTV